IIYTGFVTDEEKVSLIKNATLIVNPSRNESLSLLLLEAMNLGKTVLVNSKSDVLLGHSIKSEHATEAYLNEEDFHTKIHKYISDPKLINENEVKARDYVQKNYSWPLIMGRLKKLIESM